MKEEQKEIFKIAKTTITIVYVKDNTTTAMDTT